VKGGYSSLAFYIIDMETDKFYSIEYIEEVLKKMGIEVRNISNIKREFTKKELEKVKTSIAYKKIFSKPKRRNK